MEIRNATVNEMIVELLENLEFMLEDVLVLECIDLAERVYGTAFCDDWFDSTLSQSCRKRAQSYLEQHSGEVSAAAERVARKCLG